MEAATIVVEVAEAATIVVEVVEAATLVEVVEAATLVEVAVAATSASETETACAKCRDNFMYGVKLLTGKFIHLQPKC